MKKFLLIPILLMSVLLFAQQTPGDIKNILEQLKELEQNNDNFYDSAFSIINAQIIRAENELLASDGNNETAAINWALWQSILGDLYSSYYHNNRYRILERTQVSVDDGGGFQTYDIVTLVGEIAKCYSNSLSNATFLQRTPVQNYKELLKDENLSVEYRPTLYDLLAYKALDFFSYKIYGLPIPMRPFIVNDSLYFSDNQEFASLEITSPDSLSFQYISLKILQELTKFHLKSNYSQALVEVSLYRLNYIYGQSNLQNKDAMFLSFLKNFEKEMRHEKGVEDISYQIGCFYENRANSYVRGKTDEFRFDFVKAIYWFNKTISANANSLSAQNATIKINNIKRESISFSYENLLLPNQQSLITCQYKNCDKIFFRIVPITQKEKEEASYYSSSVYKKILEKKYLHEWSIEVTPTPDYQLRSFDAIVPALSPGEYVLVASTSGFKVDSLLGISFATLTVTNITSCKAVNDENVEFIFLNRNTGMPYKNQEVTTFYGNYKEKKRDVKRRKTDINGKISIPKKENYPYIGIELDIKGDKFEDESYEYSYSQEDTSTTVYIFTDRAIYRPGQTVYYKGIVVKSYYKNNVVLKNIPVVVSLFDANWQNVEELNLTTNEYGSFSGSFILPKDGLTGQFCLSCLGSTRFFRVEEYKRPLFEITLDAPKEDYKLNEWVELSGNATAYAGYPIDNATVKFRVKRLPKYPYWRAYIPIVGQEQEIAQGTLQTDENGKFTVKFLAKDELSLNRFTPIYHFTVIIDVTDVNGETHTITKNIPLSHQALFIRHTIPEVVVVDTEPASFELSTVNLNDEKQNSQVQCKIVQLTTPSTFRHARAGIQYPDTQFIERSVLEKAFPYLDIFNENGISTWKEKGEVLTFEITTGEKDEFIIPQINELKEGSYKIIFTTTDKYNTKVETTHNFFVQKKQSKKCNVYKPIWLYASHSTIEAGDELTLLLGSYLSSANVQLQVISNDTLLINEWITLKQGVVKYSMPITEKHSGTLKISALLIDMGREYVEKSSVQIPFSDKKLAIELVKFKNKLEPGMHEEWQLKIKGKNGENVAAELLCSMYDASLDVFQKNVFDFNINHRPFTKTVTPFSFGYFYRNLESYYYSLSSAKRSVQPRHYYSWDYYFRGANLMLKAARFESAGSGNAGRQEEMDKSVDFSEETLSLDVISGYDMELESGSGKDEEKESPIRKNFNETAFFLPKLKTDKEGNVIFSFVMPEALTTWKFQCLAHTDLLACGKLEKLVQTQKDFMLIPNLPRFLREGDTIQLTAKVVNLQNETLSGFVSLNITDAISGLQLNIVENNASQPFVTEKGKSAVVFFKMIVPQNVTSINYAMYANAFFSENDDLLTFSDGEGGVIPILSNRLQVIESMPLYINSGQTKKFTFDKLEKYITTSKESENGSLTFEFTPNPIWYVIQSLPYLTEYPYESNEQLFNRWYANTLAAQIANSSPEIKTVFESWKNLSPSAFMSNLEKNQELKNIMLTETPWVVEAQNESNAKQRIGKLFDIQNIQSDNQQVLKKLENNQHYNGAWSWVAQGSENRFITQYILAGFGHLKQLNVEYAKKDLDSYKKMLKKAIMYADKAIFTDYRLLQKDENADLAKKNISYIQYQYLYARSYFISEYKLNKTEQEAYNYYFNQAKQYWKETNSIYTQAMIALMLYRNNEFALAKEIMERIKSRAQYSEEMGMYWKKEGGGYYWYEAQVERQSLLIEAFLLILKDEPSVDKMRQWLLKQKQTQSWGTTRSTADACYALLINPDSIPPTLRIESANIEINIGDEKFNFSKSSVENNGDSLSFEAGTGYIKKVWHDSEVTKDKATVTISQQGKGIAWGGMYWKYLEQIDKITPSLNTPLTVKKNLYRVELSDRGEILVPITEENPIKLGDRVRVCIQLQSDRDMEFVHLKDLRAAAFEPVNIVSTYRYQDGLFYYETPGDVAVNFFFDYLPKGKYVFEYTLIASQTGTFINGVASVQCLYAPEFSSHSQGDKVTIKK